MLFHVFVTNNPSTVTSYCMAGFTQHIVKLKKNVNIEADYMLHFNKVPSICDVQQDHSLSCVV
jgi:hypothetical protein